MPLVAKRMNLLAKDCNSTADAPIVDFNYLFFEEPHEYVGVRQYDQKNVDRLIHIFEIEGCCNLEPEHRIAAVVDSSNFTNALSMTGATEEQLLDPASQIALKFNDNARLVCVYGKHLLRAAEAVGESCWLVDIYNDGQSPSSVQWQILNVATRSSRFGAESASLKIF
ncbi:hypothetical protein N7537_012336 [Penicillium hordei]|uniref:Uncharacterized protein n=1 Tax=Penicillium hordei TaxID=40994 RepID=A0AAD6DNG8_9EURO|nr:uncharacterized protein N7537_012336 [Penicillium hordei]KAJ5589658.1 hypothetical protein N7537_012336 [Penicillium hordei]